MSQDYPKGGPRTPFKTYESKFEQNIDAPFEPMVNNTPTSALDQMRRQQISGEFPQAVALPPHLFMPPTAQSLSIVSLTTTVPAGGFADVITWTAPRSMTTRILRYAFTNDAPAAVQIVPLVNGRRVLPYHGVPVLGNPNQSFELRGGSFLDIHFTECVLDLEPGQLMIWRAVSNGGADVSVQISLEGYVDQAQTRKPNRYG